MNNALWSPRGARAGERNRVTGYTPMNCSKIYQFEKFLRTGEQMYTKEQLPILLKKKKKTIFCLVYRDPQAF